MAKKSQRPVEPFWYVLPADRKLPAEEQSRWRFRPLTQPERLKAMDSVEAITIEATGERQLRFRSFQQARETVLLTLIEVENFPAGKPEPYDRAAPREDRERYLDTIEDADIYALGDYVFDHSTLGTDEKKS